jgi:hypothetical protein
MLRELIKALYKIVFPTYETFALTDRLSLRIVGEEFELINYGAGGSELIQFMKLSAADAKEVFRSIKQACDHREIVKAKLINCFWTIDARTSSNPSDIIIRINGSLGRVRAIAKRADVLRTVEKFNTRVGLAEGIEPAL